MKRLSQVLALTGAAILGGVVSHLMTPQTAAAQAGTTQEIRVQSLTLVDQANNPVGTFSTAQREVVLRAPDGTELWRAGTKFRTLNQR